MSAALGSGVAFVLVLALGARWSERPGRRRSGRSAAVHHRVGRASSDRWRAPAVVACGVPLLVLLGPVTAAALGVLGVAVVASAHRARRRADASARARCLPELVDLFAIAASAGHPVASALEVVAARAPAPVRPSFGAAVVRRRRGLTLDRCLALLGDDLGADADALIDVLRRSASSGAPLVPLLGEVAAGAREHRRRSAEAAARRLPVTMLLPLAGCILPAAILLAVVPVVVVSLASLR